MNKKEYYKEYVANLSNYTSGFEVIEKDIKLRKFLRFINESEDRFLEAKMNLSISQNFMIDCLAWVCFKDVEVVISDSFRKHDIMGGSSKGKREWQPTISIYNYSDFHPFETQPHYFKVKNVESDKQASEENRLIVDHWNKLVLPFMNHFDHMHTLIPYIEDDNELSKRLNPIGNYQRKLCIWYLCSHPDYEKFKNTLLDILEKNISNDRSIRFQAATKEIIDVLEKKDPIYSWDENFLIKKAIPSIVNEFTLETSEIEETQKTEESKEKVSKWNISKLWNRKNT